MAACVAMSLSRRRILARASAWRSLSPVGRLQRLVDGRAVLAGRQVGEADAVGVPLHRRRPRPNSRPTPNAAGSRCRSTTDKPDGDVAKLAMIRFPATGEKIGSLVVNPGGPGESGIEAAIGMVAVVADGDPGAIRPGRLRSARGGFVDAGTVVQLRRRQRPAARRPRGGLQPAGSRTSRTRRKEFIQRCVDKMGNEFLANVGTANVAKDLDAIRAAIGDDKLTYLGYSYGTRIGAAYAEEFPQNVRAMVLDGADRPERRPDRGRHPAGRGVPEGVQRLRRRLRQVRRTARWAPIRRKPLRCTTAWSIRWWTSRPRPRIRAGCPTATRSSAPSWRCTRRRCGGT